MRTRSRSTSRRYRAPLAAAADDPDAGESPEYLDGRVRAHAQDREQRLAAPVAAQQHDSGAERSARRARVELRAVAGMRVPAAGSTPASARRNWHLAVALGACNAEDLALADDQIDRARTARPAGPTPSARRRAVSGIDGPLRECDLSGRPIISATSAVLRDRRGLERPLHDPVPQHGHAVRDREHLGQAVADVDDADSGLRLLEHEGMELLDRRPARAPSWARRGAAPSGRVNSALTTSSSCRSASERAPVAASRDRCRGLKAASVSSAQLCMCACDGRAPRRAPRGRGSRPRSGRGRASSPGRRCRGRAAGPWRGRRARPLPPISTVPSSGARNPLAIPSNVDFPDPFSPTRAWISPARQSKLTSRSA